MNNSKINADLDEKIDGHFEELKGKIMEQSGAPVAGGAHVAKGKIENADADADINFRNNYQQINHEIERAKKKVKKDVQAAMDDDAILED